LQKVLDDLLHVAGQYVGRAIQVVEGRRPLSPRGGDPPHSLGGMAATTSMGQPLPSYGALAVAAVLSAFFVTISIWRFDREEL
jgi:hypothetical protein